MLYNVNEINHQADTDKWPEPDWTGRCCQSKRNQVFGSANHQRPSPAHCSVESCRVFSPGTKSQHLSNKWSHWSKQSPSLPRWRCGCWSTTGNTLQRRYRSVWGENAFSSPVTSCPYWPKYSCKHKHTVHKVIDHLFVDTLLIHCYVI